MPRPCPFVSCRWHLAVDVTGAGSLTENFPDLDVDELTETCALDVADRGGHGAETVGRLLNVTRETVRLITLRAQSKVARAMAPEATETPPAPA